MVVRLTAPKRRPSQVPGASTCTASASEARRRRAVPLKGTMQMAVGPRHLGGAARPPPPHQLLTTTTYLMGDGADATMANASAASCTDRRIFVERCKGARQANRRYVRSSGTSRSVASTSQRFHHAARKQNFNLTVNCFTIQLSWDAKVAFQARAAHIPSPLRLLCSPSRSPPGVWTDYTCRHAPARRASERPQHPRRAPWRGCSMTRTRLSTSC
jgi:hypothetical protein